MIGNTLLPLCRCGRHYTWEDAAECIRRQCEREFAERVARIAAAAGPAGETPLCFGAERGPRQ